MKRYYKILFLMVTVLLLIVLINIIAKDNSSNVYAASSSSTSDLQLMARAINGEARGEPYEGQVAVGAVILNRVRSSSFPNTIAGVIYEPGAFT
ncbi:cell wall hydrolase, partial [Faecalibacillus intestinalis]|uniref:cell wall hydrolase n=1 Tax=Faecalibacillus intestinalis TaxID=1982626 RepID=UPI00295E7CC9